MSDLLAAESTIGEPAINISIFGVFVLVTLFITFRASRNNKSAADYYAAGRNISGDPERPGDRGRLPLGGLVPGHRRRHRRLRLRRLPVLDRLPGRLAGRAAARRGADAQHGPVHDGRRPGLPDAAAAGAHGRGHLDPDRVAVLPAGPDGGRRRTGHPAARRERRGGAGRRRHHRRRADDLLRAGRRHARHHLRADHQGVAADHRRLRDDGLGARQVRVQPVRAARRRAGRTPSRAATSSPPARSTARPSTSKLDFVSLGPGAGAGDGGSAARADALLHGARRRRTPAVRSSGPSG